MAQNLKEDTVVSVRTPYNGFIHVYKRNLRVEPYWGGPLSRAILSGAARCRAIVLQPVGYLSLSVRFQESCMTICH